MIIYKIKRTAQYFDLFNKKRLTIGLIIKRLWTKRPLSIFLKTVSNQFQTSNNLAHFDNDSVGF
jgi:hypothetical protein